MYIRISSHEQTQIGSYEETQFVISVSLIDNRKWTKRKTYNDFSLLKGALPFGI